MIFSQDPLEKLKTIREGVIALRSDDDVSDGCSNT
jgi:hypothetical protein